MNSLNWFRELQTKNPEPDLRLRVAITHANDLPRAPAGKKVKTVKPGSEISHCKEDFENKKTADVTLRFTGRTHEDLPRRVNRRSPKKVKVGSAELHFSRLACKSVTLNPNRAFLGSSSTRLGGLFGGDGLKCFLNEL
ncbi:hypothetical protein NIES2135_12090 [Leptolyngbya boryana NIES-2135]|jgi:hypothetical protein|uniref:Uncharacterized protein n=1 Tax=Leptolyngbya boryana NIES-2135 TaxID=1973484 RepID=A0A1Z4JCB3_LEPBY|nr:hypothetical protein NIES2135_12090 [Leptolyngbya boryana NIES-2135]